ncbi:hypothetical protein LRP52_19140 [Photobacterium sp. ZSDE20]|nr:hypothetical protein [Photobacterium sp. ZSDE20]
MKKILLLTALLSSPVIADDWIASESLTSATLSSDMGYYWLAMVSLDSQCNPKIRIMQDKSQWDVEGTVVPASVGGLHSKPVHSDMNNLVVSKFIKQESVTINSSTYSAKGFAKALNTIKARCKPL